MWSVHLVNLLQFGLFGKRGLIKRSAHLPPLSLKCSYLKNFLLLNSGKTSSPSSPSLAFFLLKVSDLLGSPSIVIGMDCLSGYKKSWLDVKGFTKRIITILPGSVLKCFYLERLCLCGARLTNLVSRL